MKAIRRWCASAGVAIGVAVASVGCEANESSQRPQDATSTDVASREHLPPILDAALGGDPPAVAAALAAGADPAAPHEIWSDALRARGSDIELGTRLVVTPVLLAAFGGHIDVLEILVAHGADPNATNTDGLTATLAATYANHEAAVRWLLAHGATVDHRADDGSTALTVAVDERRLAIAEALLQAGADAQIPNPQGMTPMDVALARADAELARLLQRHGVSLDASDEDLSTAAVDVRGFATPPGIATRAEPSRRGLLGLAIDATGGWIYWSEYAFDRILRARLDGSGVATIVDEYAQGPIGVAVSPDGRHLYWTNDSTYPRSVRHLDTDDGTVTTLTLGPLVNRPRAIAAAPGNVFWSEVINGRLIGFRIGDPAPFEIRTDRIASYREQSDYDPLFVLGLAADVQRLYWTEFLGSTISTTDFDGNDFRHLFTAKDGVEFLVGLAVDPARGVLYWADVAREAILSARIDGGSPVVLVDAADGLIEPRAVAVDSDTGRVYWTDASRNEIGRATTDGTVIEWMAVDGSAELGFATAPPTPSSCSGSVRAAARDFRLRAYKRASVCLEKVDAVKALKRTADDARMAAATCVGQLATLHPGGPHALTARIAALGADRCRTSTVAVADLDAGCSGESSDCASSECAIRSCRTSIWRLVAAAHPRTVEWIEEVRPFMENAAATVAAKAESEASRALEVIDEIASVARALRPATARSEGLPSTGMTSSYAAVRPGKRAARAVADDAAAAAGAPMRFIDNGDGTITDHVTGMMWEKKSDHRGTLHDYREAFRWSGDGTQVTIWDWLAAINSEGGSGFAGHSDWRIPNVKELQSIVDYERFNPAVGSAFDGARCGLGCEDLGQSECSCTSLRP